MATTRNGIKVDFGLGATPPTVTFLQGADMQLINIRRTLRDIEQTEEGVMFGGSIMASGQINGWICKAGGLFRVSLLETTYIIVEIGTPFVIKFEAGVIPFATVQGTLLGNFVESPGAIVQINNDLGGITLANSELNDKNLQDAASYSKLGANQTSHLSQ